VSGIAEVKADEDAMFAVVSGIAEVRVDDAAMFAGTKECGSEDTFEA
jgi:hypothetical protein